MRGRAGRARGRPAARGRAPLRPPRRAREAARGGERELAELQADRKMLKEEVDEEDVAEVVAKWTGIPVSRLMEGEMQKLVHMEDASARAGRRPGRGGRRPSPTRSAARAPGCRTPTGPIGSFLFLGPTGVGKTELATRARRVPVRRRAGDRPHRHERVPGAPHRLAARRRAAGLRRLRGGRAAHRGGPPAAVRVVLLDEMEKAHGDVFNILLQLLDDGRLTDGQGRTVDFRNTIVIMTSNLGSAVFGDRPRRREEQKDEVLAEVRGYVPAGVHEPDRRDRRVPAARPRADPHDRRTPAAVLRDAARRARPHPRGSPRRATTTWRTRATTRRSAPGR